MIVNSIVPHNTQALADNYPDIYAFSLKAKWGDRVPAAIASTPFGDTYLMFAVEFAHWYDRWHNPERLEHNIAIPAKADVTMEEALSDSVERCKAFAKGKQLFLMWSGGIDSTLAFYALQTAGVPFTVMCSEASEQEYPRLYEEISSGKIPNVWMRDTSDAFSSLTADDNNRFITGEHGDQMMGNMAAVRLGHAGRMQTLSEAASRNTLAPTRALSDHEASDSFTRNVIQYIFPTMREVFPHKTADNTTLSELLWFANFNYKYFTVAYRRYNMGTLCGVNTLHFFNTEKWQQYAMGHFERNCVYAKNTGYKQPYKDFIYSCNGDARYRDTKLKIASNRIFVFKQP